MNYTIHGPFKFKKQNIGLIDRSKSARNQFWDNVQQEHPTLPSACGCYLFAIRAAKGIKPWYVGLAERQSFENECFSPHKLTIYNDALAQKKGTPILFLIAKRTNKDKFSKLSRKRHKSSRFLESMLIGIAIEKNPKLLNIYKTKYLRRISVPGLINTPKRRPTDPESEFKKAID